MIKVLSKKQVLQQFLKNWPDWIMPLSFCATNLANLVLFYLGFGFEENPVRAYGFLLVGSLYALLTGLSFLAVLRSRRLSRRTLLLGAVLLFFAVCFGAAFLKFGFTGSFLYQAKHFVSLALPAFFAGVYGAANGRTRSFFSALESLSFLAFPAAVIYANSVTWNSLPWNYNSNLGILNYMTLAYSFLPFLLAHLIGYARQSDLQLPFGKKPLRHPQRLRVLFLAYYWLAILVSFTRGAYVCIFGFCVFLVFSLQLHREKTARRIAVISAAMAALLLFNMFVYAPPGLYRVSRVNTFVDGLKAGELVTSRDGDAAIRDRIDELVSADGGQQIANRPADGDPSDPFGNGIAAENPQFGSRGTLFKLAVKEFLKSPVLGMTPTGFSVKYGHYPHNAVLELLCETGIVGTGFLLALLLYVFVRLLLIGRKDPDVRYLLLFLLAYAIQANISGSVWECSALLFALGYGISLPGKLHAPASESEEKELAP